MHDEKRRKVASNSNSIVFIWKPLKTEKKGACSDSALFFLYTGPIINPSFRSTFQMAPEKNCS
jgi:hypothetical protein